MANTSPELKRHLYKSKDNSNLPLSGWPAFLSDSWGEQSFPPISRSNGLQMKKLLFLAILAVLIGSAGNLGTSQSAAAPARKTSPPYTGDLSIFESLGREDRLVRNLLSLALP